MMPDKSTFTYLISEIFKRELSYLGQRSLANFLLLKNGNRDINLRNIELVIINGTRKQQIGH